MSSAFYLNRWVLSISTATITVVGTLSSVTVSPAVAQTTPCISDAVFNTGTFDIRDITKNPDQNLSPIPNPDPPPSTISSLSQNAAQDAGLAFYPNTNTPNILFSRFDNDGGVFEYRGRQPNGCLLEVDVESQGVIQEIEQQIRTSNFSTQVPTAVRNRLNQEIPNRTILFIEKSIRPGEPVGPNESLSGFPVFYEIEVRCTGTNPIPGPTPGNYCVNGQSGEATISANGNNFEFVLNQD